MWWPALDPKYNSDLIFATRSDVKTSFIGHKIIKHNHACSFNALQGRLWMHSEAASSFFCNDRFVPDMQLVTLLVILLKQVETVDSDAETEAPVDSDKDVLDSTEDEESS